MIPPVSLANRSRVGGVVRDAGLSTPAQLAKLAGPERMAIAQDESTKSPSRSSANPPHRLSWIGVWTSAAIGVCFAIWTFGIDFFSGDPVYWDYLWGDAGSGLAALRYYLDEPWGFPLLQADTINTPEGVNLAFTDSLPILALLAKVLRPLGIGPGQWWSWWYLVLYAAQGASAAYAVRAWGARSTVIQISAAVVALGGPIFLIRTWHPGLAGQFTLLLAWAFVGRLRSDPSSWRHLRFGVIVALVALLIHVYLLFGVVVILVGGVLNEAARGTLAWTTAARWFGALSFAVVAVGALCGYFTTGAARANGYFLVGMHLLGPVVPQRSTFWPGNEWTINASGSFEAINWIGFGWLGIVLLGVAVSLRKVPEVARRYQVLIAAVLLLTAYSVTPVIRLWDDNPHDLRTPLRWVYTDFESHRFVYGAAALLAVALGAVLIRQRPSFAFRNGLIALMVPAALWGISMLSSPIAIEVVTGQFRSAGRLFWGVSYGALVLGAAALDRARERTGSALFVVVAVALALVQVVDTAAFRGLGGETLDPTNERIERLDGIADLIVGFERIHLEPAYNCAVALAGTEGVWAYQDIGHVASWTLQDIDAAYAARKPDEDCSVPPVLVSDPEVVNVVVAASDFLATVPASYDCRSVGLVVACTTK